VRRVVERCGHRRFLDRSGRRRDAAPAVGHRGPVGARRLLVGLGTAVRGGAW